MWLISTCSESIPSTSYNKIIRSRHIIFTSIKMRCNHGNFVLQYVHHLDFRTIVQCAFRAMNFGGKTQNDPYLIDFNSKRFEALGIFGGGSMIRSRVHERHVCHANSWGLWECGEARIYPRQQSFWVISNRTANNITMVTGGDFYILLVTIPFLHYCQDYY